VAEDSSHTGYYWLAYTWANLYPSCVFCNQRRKDQPTFDAPVLGPATGKLDQFPVADETTGLMPPAIPSRTKTPCSLTRAVNSAMVSAIRDDPAIFGF